MDLQRGAGKVADVDDPTELELEVCLGEDLEVLECGLGGAVAFCHKLLED